MASTSQVIQVLGELDDNLASAGIAFALAGRSARAAESFRACLATDDDREFVLEEKRRVRELLDLVALPAVFVRRVNASIARTRELLRLPALTELPF